MDSFRRQSELRYIADYLLPFGDTLVADIEVR